MALPPTIIEWMRETLVLDLLVISLFKCLMLILYLAITAASEKYLKKASPAASKPNAKKG